MSMRELVTGGAACAVSGSSSSSSNPLGALANALIGSSSKTQERLKEIPNAAAATSHTQFYDDPVAALPGSELDHPFLQSNAQGSDFIRGFRTAHDNGLADAWDEIQRQPHLDRVYNAAPAPPIQPTLDGPPQRVLSSFLHSFVDSSRSGIPLHPTPLPLLGLSQGDKQCIRDRSSIMARHFFADKSEEFINSQVNALLSSLEIDSDSHAKGPMPGRFRELEDYWNESQGILKPGAHAADGWVTEFSQHRAQHGDPDAWAHSFEQQHGAGGWASEFEQNSKFLQFVSKMSRGELIIDDNQVKPASGSWATEYQQQFNGGASWADEFVHDEVSHGPAQWVNEFATEREQEPVDDQWVNEFSKLHVDDWAEEFGRQVGEGALGDSSSDNWATAYDEFLNEQVASKERSDASTGVYVFSDMNPYVGHPNPLKEGQELFRKGLLSEAVLALEAEVMKNPENAEGWRLLGITHAENDDDQQAIAAMMRAQEADPTNLEVLLALGVSHTNELEQAAALKYLYGWLRHHPKYGTLALPELVDSLYYADVARLFNEAAQMSPEDADVHVVLGVLYNLSREYDKAIASFKTALKLQPNDYSLWNKLGATQANSVQSADAILAYQQALDLKPNYVRAWANMGISYANQLCFSK
ncbi:Peroxin 5 isoform 7 [Theobroma cacao]|uniref:Peroxin 5 isoform 7 n=1 Tax=Theobroma cacao TaxID=3641 RepID=A0A061F568_THECC|nr:Peroxin 5 isoform 7 [Theobroma cacao]